MNKTNDPRIDLKSGGDAGNNDGKAVIDLVSGNHKKKFTEKIKKIMDERPVRKTAAAKLETKERTAEKNPAAGRGGKKRDPETDRTVTDLRNVPASAAEAARGNEETAGLELDLSRAPVSGMIDAARTREAAENGRPREIVADLSREAPAARATEEIAAVAGPEPEAEKTEMPVLPAIRKKYERLEFPRGFLWGTSTSAYQVEGGITNDWSQWEKSFKRLRQLMKKKKPSADYICGRACDSYNRFAEDLDLAKALNNNAIRFGLEWARICPQKDTINIEALDHYRAMLSEAKKRGLTTVVTLWHWTNPLWLAKTGGWENKKAIKHFSSYVGVAVKEMGAGVDYWFTVNEPNMYVFGAYLRNQFPPQKWNVFLATRVFLNLTRAHNRAYRIIHRHFPRARVGFTGLFNYIEPANRWNPLAIGMAALLHYFWNGWLFRRTRKHFDFIGVNYYFHDRIVAYPPFKMNRNEWVNDKGWEIYPKGIYHILKYLRKFGKPILITENGVADAEDRHRAKFIERHLYWTHKAIEEGADVRGYFHWSLLDNFEWADGWPPKFGLYEVDRKTFARKPRPSAAFYADICRKNRIKIKT